MDFESFAHMGGYALNVWGAYGLTLAVYTGLMLHAIVKCDRLDKADKDHDK